MARTLKWRDRIPEIRQRVQNSVVETWTRKDLESIFEVKRAAAQLLMKAIGEIQNLGGTHVVARASLLTFLETVEGADNPEATRREMILLAEPVPRPRFLKTTVPEELRSVMARDLPREIVLSPGRLEIVGRTSSEILERLVLLARALQNDLGTVTEMLEPPPVVPVVQDEDLAALFADLRQREQAWKQKAADAGADQPQAISERSSHENQTFSTLHA